MRSKPKKSLGQNFLSDPNILRKISAAISLGPGDTVLEIGSGRGELTRLLVARACRVYAVEIDNSLMPDLKDNLGKFSNICFINADILKLDFKKYFKKKIIVAGNIPYYISTPILERVFSHRRLIRDVYLTVQKEFAARLCAKPGSKDYGSLSCFTQFYSSPEILFHISKNCFFPRPKVDSSFVRLSIKADTGLSAPQEKKLFKIIRCAFGQRRKTLRNSLDGVASCAKLELFLKGCGLDWNIRPEQLSLEHFMRLSKA